MQRNFNFSHKSQLLEERENWTCLHISRCQQWYQSEHNKDKLAPEPPQPPKKSNVNKNNLYPHGDLYLQSEKGIDHIKDSSEGKARCSLQIWVGIETQKDVMRCPTCNVNLCVLCYRLFNSDVDIAKIQDYFSTIFKRLQIHENYQILYFCTV